MTVTSLDLSASESPALAPQAPFPSGQQLVADVGCFEFYLDPALNGGCPGVDHFLSTQWSPVGAGELGR